MSILTNVILISVFSFICLPNSILAQAPDTLWTKTFGGINDDFGRYAIQTSDDGYILAGYTRSFGVGTNNIWIIKTDVNGDTLWTKLLGGMGDERVYSFQKTSDDGYILSGRTDSYGAGGDDIWIVKINEAADTLWTKTFGGSLNEWGQSIQQTSDGGYIITGFTESYGAGGSDVWLIKTDEFADTVWTKTYGGNSLDWGNDVKQTSDGGYIITGRTGSYGAGSEDIWLIKTDSVGDTLWTKTFGGIDNEEGNSVEQTTDFGYMISGFTESYGSGDKDVWLIKTNADGNMLWAKTYGGIDEDIGFTLQKSSDSGYIICGYTKSYGAGDRDGWLIRSDSSGDTLWTKVLGGISADFTGGINPTSDGGYIITGFTFSYGAGGADIWLIRLNADLSPILDNSLKLPIDYNLCQNYPNPFNPSTTIKFEIPERSFTTLKIYDVLGCEITTLVKEEISAGSFEVEWNAVGLPSGIYFYRLQAGSFVETKKMILMK